MRNIIMSWEGKRRQVEAFVCLLVSVCVCVCLRRKKKLKVIVCVCVCVGRRRKSNNIERRKAYSKKKTWQPEKSLSRASLLSEQEKVADH